MPARAMAGSQLTHQDFAAVAASGVGASGQGGHIVPGPQGPSDGTAVLQTIGN